MLRPARPHPARVILALVVLSLPLGWIGRSWLSATLAVPVALGLLLVPTWFSLRRARDSADGTAAVLRAALVVLAALGIAKGLGLGLSGAGWLLCGTTAALLLSPAPSAPPAPRPPGAVASILAVALMAIVIYQPLALTLSSDAPAHVAGILDAREANSLQPPDVFPGADAGSVDPRYGILHGLYAEITRWTAASAANTLRWSALFLSPLWFIAYLQLLRRLGFGPRVAALTAFVFTLYAGGGRGFGLSGAGFPGSVAQILCTFGLVGLVDARTARAASVPVAVLALSTLVHPFAWWSTCIVAGCAGLMMLVRDRTRPDGRRWLVMAAATAVAGALLLTPRLLAREASADGLHTQLLQVVFVGGGLFFADPFWVFRWGGVASVLALPALGLVALLSTGWVRRPENLVGAALAVPVWLISLNPLLAPAAWSIVSYLVIRLGRVVLTTWVWVSAIQAGASRWRDGGRAMLAGSVLLLVGGAGLWHEGSTVWLNLRQAQVVNAPGTESHLDELATALGTVETEWLLAAPRLGYGLRARGGPRLILPPVAHASPDDSTLMLRLARWRELYDPSLTDAELRARLDEFGEATLLVDASASRVHDGVNEYAYVPDRDRALALRARLRALGYPVVASGDGFAAFQLRGPVPMRFAPGPGGTLPAGPGFRVDGVELGADRASPGSRVPLTLELQATGHAPPRPERIFVRVEGDMPGAPSALGQVSKLWRKLVTERSGRSERRFGQWVVPADLVVPPERWPDGRWRQTIELRIPAWAAPGDYHLEVTQHEWSWHENHELSDYLQDEDRFSGPRRATLHIGD